MCYSVTDLCLGPPSDISLVVSVEFLYFSVGLFHLENTAKLVKLALFHVTFLEDFDTVLWTVHDDFCVPINQRLNRSLILGPSSRHIAAIISFWIILGLSEHNYLLSC